MLDPEPTLAAPSEDETQSLHAWSQEDTATEIVDYRPRTWRTPVALAITVLAAVIGIGTFLAWPESATNQQVAPANPQVAAKPTIVNTPPVQPQNPNQRFIAIFKSRGGKPEPGREMVVAGQAQQVCTALTSRDEATLVDQMLAKSPGINRYTAQLFADTAIDVYCPQYGPQK